MASYQFGGGRLQEYYNTMDSFKPISGGVGGNLPAYSIEDAKRMTTLRSMLPYIAQMDQVDAQQRAQEEAEKRRYRYQYGL